MNAETYLANAIDPETGAIRPYSQLAEADLTAQSAARHARMLAADARAAADKRTEKQISVDLYQSQYDQARRSGDSGDSGRAKYWKSQLDTAKESRAAEVTKEERAKMFAGDRRISLIREEADAIARSGHALLPHSSQADRDALVSLARSDDWPDPQSQFLAFKQLSDRLTDVELEATRVKQSDAEIESALQNVTLAESKIQQLELQSMRARRENVAE